MPAATRNEYRMRMADARDLPRLQEIAVQAFGAAAIPDLAALQREESLFVAEWRTAIDGFIVLLALKNALLIHRLAVAENARGGGLGSWLLDFAVQHARSLGLRSVEMQLGADQRAAIDWMNRRGFTQAHHGGNRLYLQKPVA